MVAASEEASLPSPLPASATRVCPFSDSWPPKIYDTLLKDARAGSLLAHPKQERLKEALDAFMHRTRVTETGMHELATKHQEWAITHYDFDCFLKSLRAYMSEPRSEEASHQLGQLES